MSSSTFLEALRRGSQPVSQSGTINIRIAWWSYLIISKVSSEEMKLTLHHRRFWFVCILNDRTSVMFGCEVIRRRNIRVQPPLSNTVEKEIRLAFLSIFAVFISQNDELSRTTKIFLFQKDEILDFRFFVVFEDSDSLVLDILQIFNPTSFFLPVSDLFKSF